MYGHERMKWMINHGTLNFTPSHMNDVLVETWEAFKLSSDTTAQEDFNKTHLLHFLLPDKYTNHQYFLAATQTSKDQKSDEIELI